MAYSTGGLTTHAECDLLILHGQEEARMAQYQLSVLGHSAQNATLSATEYSAELVGLNLEVTSMTGLIPTLPIGDYRTKKENELRKLTDRRDELTARQQAAGTVALIKRELDVAQAQAALDAANAMIAAVQARKAAL
jgi:hypothetical protein